MKVQHKINTFDAEQLNEELTIVTSHGRYSGKPGDYLLTSEKGDHLIVSEYQFWQLFEEVGYGNAEYQPTKQTMNNQKFRNQIADMILKDDEGKDLIVLSGLEQGEDSTMHFVVGEDSATGAKYSVTIKIEEI